MVIQRIMSNCFGRAAVNDNKKTDGIELQRPRSQSRCAPSKKRPSSYLARWFWASSSASPSSGRKSDPNRSVYGYSGTFTSTASSSCAWSTPTASSSAIASNQVRRMKSLSLDGFQQEKSGSVDASSGFLDRAFENASFVDGLGHDW